MVPLCDLLKKSTNDWRNGRTRKWKKIKQIDYKMSGLSPLILFYAYLSFAFLHVPMQKVICMSNFLNASPFSGQRLSILSWTLKRLRLLGSPSLFLAGTWKSHFSSLGLFVISLKRAHFLLIFHKFHIFLKNNCESSCGIGKRLYLCTRFRKRRRQEIVLWQIVDRKKWQGSCGA